MKFLSPFPHSVVRGRASACCAVSRCVPQNVGTGFVPTFFPAALRAALGVASRKKVGTFFVPTFFTERNALTHTASHEQVFFIFLFFIFFTKFHYHRILHHHPPHLLSLLIYIHLVCNHLDFW